ncbi:RNA polymerase sigma factor RpoE [Plesiocystis pacifica SIR-1]|uniref:RNA polymerase sigma factor RpoE n=1 Tax=Plesiocystis pacifica SIR-1 TaxID=391625 RepID=A6G5L6_9BACT|nr:RNA polymerase sigma factor [Plesiocystis pacifica]EDM78797.1 RNA polymerase sigma factor RpoE [Plesiocystis pacifica SIR-1]
MVEKTDDDLLVDWREGDRRAGKALFERYYDAINRFFRNKVGAAEAQDLVQKTFLGCLEGFERFRGDGEFRTWLFAVAYRQLCKHYRARNREQERFDVGEVTARDVDPTPSRVYAKLREQRLLLEALRRIPVPMQVALELRYWEQMTDVQIAQALDMPLGTFKSRLRRAKQLLAEAITEISSSQDELQSTLGNLDGWAEQLRELALGSDESD